MDEIRLVTLKFLSCIYSSEACNKLHCGEAYLFKPDLVYKAVKVRMVPLDQSCFSAEQLPCIAPAFVITSSFDAKETFWNALLSFPCGATLECPFIILILHYTASNIDENMCITYKLPIIKLNALIILLGKRNKS